MAINERILLSYYLHLHLPLHHQPIVTDAVSALFVTTTATHFNPVKSSHCNAMHCIALHCMPCHVMPCQIIPVQSSHCTPLHCIAWHSCIACQVMSCHSNPIHLLLLPTRVATHSRHLYFLFAPVVVLFLLVAIPFNHFAPITPLLIGQWNDSSYLLCIPSTALLVVIVVLSCRRCSLPPTPLQPPPSIRPVTALSFSASPSPSLFSLSLLPFSLSPLLIPTQFA